MKVGRVAIITRGRYAGKKVRQAFSFPTCSSENLDEGSGSKLFDG